VIIPNHEIMPVIRAALERGQRVRMTVTGTSMRPFIHDGDVVELEPVRSMPRLGDVVQVQCSEECCVVHRVVRIEGEAFFLRGDANAHCEGPFGRDSLCGRVILCYRNGRARAYDCGVWRFAGLAWAWCFPLFRVLRRASGSVRRIGGKVLPAMKETVGKTLSS